MCDRHRVLFWFRRDLRLADNPALSTACAAGDVIPVFIWSQEDEGRWPIGAASRWWLHHSLQSLDASLRDRGSRLIVRAGSAHQKIAELIDETGAETVYWNRRYEPAARACEDRVALALHKKRAKFETGNSALLFQPMDIRTDEGKPYRVFTPCWRKCMEQPKYAPPIGEPATFQAPKRWPSSLRLEDLELLPKLDWAQGLLESWNPGESGAAEALKSFCKRAVGSYATARDRPADAGTSRLSPHLHFGEISPRQVWALISNNSEGSQRFRTELGWREFAHHLLWHFPNSQDQPLHRRFARFPWRRSAAGLKLWQQGQTGFPIVDAGMRQLWKTGWMHNRVRMIVASFLVKDLLISWREGARWFWDTLVDADLANNTLGWQWTAGCGADAAPFFRIFNPVTQGQKFDADGSYIRMWIPELANLSKKWLHCPWEAQEEELARAGVKLGRTYPFPMVDHAEARARALAAFKKL